MICLTNELKAVGIRIQEARKAAGINQTQFAEMVDISVSHLSAIETGRSNFGVDILMRITEILKVSADSLLRTDIPAVSAIYGTEIDEILKDCPPIQIEAMITTLKQMKDAFQMASQAEHNK